VPAKGDHDEKRRDVSRAVWRVLATRGFSGLTLRAVATELGASTGLVTHYFPGKQALVKHAVEVAEEQVRGRNRPLVASGLTGLREALLFVLPLDTETSDMNRVWVSFWGEALSDGDLTAFEVWRYERWRGMLRPHLEAAQRLGELRGDADVDDLTVAAAAFAHGLVVQALFDPARLPADRQIRIVDGYIEGLRRHA
jgi:AcrR family transcriptional regulator